MIQAIPSIILIYMAQWNYIRLSIFVNILEGKVFSSLKFDLREKGR